MNPESTIALSLISHTNVGKTTLARTLLGRDIGEVRDAQHVTQEATPYPLIETPEGDTLVAVGHARLRRQRAARAAAAAARQSDRLVPVAGLGPLPRSRVLSLAAGRAQRARSGRRRALSRQRVGSRPRTPATSHPELEHARVDRQAGGRAAQPDRPPTSARRGGGRGSIWRAALEPRPIVRAVMTFDAFARCWVQEIALSRPRWRRSPGSAPRDLARVVDAWQARRLAQFDDAMPALAAPIAAAACDRESLPETGAAGTLRGIGSGLGLGDDAMDGAQNTRVARDGRRGSTKDYA